MTEVKPHNHLRLHDPKVIGPGIWFCMHSKSAKAKTLIAKQKSIDDIRELQADFPCKMCKTHFGEYLEHHPPENSLDGDEKSIFHWTVDFHNDVNAATKKAQLSYREAEELYFTDAIECEKSCFVEEQEPLNFTIRPIS